VRVSDQELRIETTSQDGVAVLRPEGEVGTHEAPTLRQHLKDAFDQRPRRVVVDLSGVEYMATAGLATLVEGLQRSKREQTELVLCGLRERVQAVFEISRLTSVFRIAQSASDAVR
jgi:anti-sigma B factor antagonist